MCYNRKRTWQLSITYGMSKSWTFIGEQGCLTSSPRNLSERLRDYNLGKRKTVLHPKFYQRGKKRRLSQPQTVSIWQSPHKNLQISMANLLVLCMFYKNIQNFTESWQVEVDQKVLYDPLFLYLTLEAIVYCYVNPDFVFILCATCLRAQQSHWPQKIQSNYLITHFMEEGRSQT